MICMAFGSYYQLLDRNVVFSINAPIPHTPKDAFVRFLGKGNLDPERGFGFVGFL